MIEPKYYAAGWAAKIAAAAITIYLLTAAARSLFF